MKANIIALLCTIFFIGTNIRTVILSMPIEYLYYALFAYGLLIMGIYKYGQELTKVEHLAVWIIGSALTWLCAQYMIAGRGQLGGVFCVLIFPAFLISTLPHRFGVENIKLKIALSHFLYIFFIIECSIAIVEFIMRQHIFGFIEMTYWKGLVQYTQDEFRSAALLGSPLNNALVVTILMLFYLYDSRLSVKNKMLLWLLGLVAIFCFNARTAIAINLLSLVAYVTKVVFARNTEKRYQYIFLSIAVCLVLFLLYNYGWGNRFWKTDSFNKDASIRVRLRLFEYMLKADWSDYLWGYSGLKINQMMKTEIGVKIIENFWILYIFRLGIPLTIYFIVLYGKLCGNLLASYSRFDKIIISLSFVILASSNNSLFANFIPLFTFMLCAYTYSPLVAYIHDRDTLSLGNYPKTHY